MAKWARGNSARTIFAVWPVSTRSSTISTPAPSPAAERDDRRRDVLEHLQLALGGVVVARHAHRLDQPDVELARDDRRRHQAAAGDADDRLERAGAVEPPGERARIAMELVPRDRKDFLRRRSPLRRLFACVSLSRFAPALVYVLARRFAPVPPARLRTRASMASTALLAAASFADRASAPRHWCCRRVSSKNG